MKKIIHYCWFGHNPLPKLALRCIESWKKYLPDYEIKEWNEDNFDVNIVPYTQEAYAAKKYAFVSDYARFWILYNYGGLYFDTDVEVIRPLDDIITRGPFMGFENEIIINNVPFLTVAPGLGLGVDSGSNLYKEVLDLYSSLHFVNKDGSLNTHKSRIKILFEDVYKCNNKELFLWDSIYDAYLKYIHLDNQEYLCFADDEKTPSIYIVCKSMKYEVL